MEGAMTTSAKVITDSISEAGIRITTLELEYPLIIHGELISRNAASNRAIPTKKILEQVENYPFHPENWGRNQPGMQAGGELSDGDKLEATRVWERSIEDAVFWATKLDGLGVHKQLANRLLMPFQYIKTIVTATEWDNFFKLCLHPDAQPEIQELAKCVKEALNNSTPRLLRPGEWHMTYVDIDMSPFEHIATPMNFAKDTFELAWENGVTHKDRDNNFWSGNFRGWIQYRQLL